jgi:hypothetical protein
MNRIHRSSLALGVALGLLAAAALQRVPPLRAQDAKKEALSQEELDKRLDEVLEAQKKLLERLDTVTTQTQFLKASSGK